MSEQKPIKMWGGFRSCRLAWFYGARAIFTTKASARREFADVRPVWIVFEEPKEDA